MWRTLRFVPPSFKLVMGEDSTVHEMQNYLDPEKSDRRNLHCECRSGCSGQLKRPSALSAAI